MDELEFLARYAEPIGTTPGGKDVFEVPVCKIYEDTVKNDFGGIVKNIDKDFKNVGTPAFTYPVDGDGYSYGYDFFHYHKEFSPECLELRAYVDKDDKVETSMLLKGKLYEKDLNMLFGTMSGKFFEGCKFSPVKKDSMEVLQKFNEYCKKFENKEVKYVVVETAKGGKKRE